MQFRPSSHSTPPVRRNPVNSDGTSCEFQPFATIGRAWEVSVLRKKRAQPGELFGPDACGFEPFDGIAGGMVVTGLVLAGAAVALGLYFGKRR